MPNIMLTDLCNLHCAYCFADEFVNKNINEISLDVFNQALDFIAKDNNPYVKLGLIGGEPTLHSKFKDILKILIEDERFMNVFLFTNGIKLDSFFNELSNPKFSILINCNSPEDIGENNYRKICDNLDFLITNCNMKNRITLGINIYKSNMNFEFILSLLKKYEYSNVRMSVVVPNKNEKEEINAEEYFKSLKSELLRFIDLMLDNGIIPTYDCNKVPSCLFDEKEKSTMEKAVMRMLESENLQSQKDAAQHCFSICNNIVKCVPAIDILQDLTAVRCFGLSRYTKVKLSDFENIKELTDYYKSNFDLPSYSENAFSKCSGCDLRKEQKCMGGCLIFKIDSILSNNYHSEKHK